MKLSKILVSSAAAASVVGAIGFAYAQTYSPTTPTTPGNNPQTQIDVQVPAPASPTDTNTQNQRRNSSTGTTGSMNDNTRMSGDNSTSSIDNNRSTERMARADRN